MKNQVITIKRGADYVRFGFDVTVQTKIGLVVNAVVFGDINKGGGNFCGIDFINTDDICWEELYFGGEKVDFIGFKETFNKLFKRDFKEFEAEVNQLIEKEIENQFSRALKHFSRMDLKRAARDYFSKAELAWCYTSSDSMIQASSSKDWEFNQVVQAITGKNISKYRAQGHDGWVWGYSKDYLTQLFKY